MDFSVRAVLNISPHELSLKRELRSQLISEKISVLQSPPSSAHRVPLILSLLPWLSLWPFLRLSHSDPSSYSRSYSRSASVVRRRLWHVYVSLSLSLSLYIYIYIHIYIYIYICIERERCVYIYIYI